MDFKHFTAGKDDTDRRLDKIIRRFLDENALSSIYKSLRKGLIKVNGKKQDSNFKVHEGDVISIADFLIKSNSNSENKNSSELNKKLDKKIILFRNEYILFLNKPYDIPVQPAKEFKGKTLSEMVEEDYKTIHSENTSLAFRTGPLHRLDRKTTGLIAFSQNLQGAKIFSEIMKNHFLKKIYLGIVLGKLEKEQIWINKIEKSEKTKNGFHTVKVFEEKNENGKESYTEAKPLAYGKYNGKDVTLVQFTIKTGRTHQIRSQSAINGFPLLGDTAYGSFKLQNENRDFFLHAYKLEFNSAKNTINLPNQIEAPIDEIFQNILKKISINFSENLIK